MENNTEAPLKTKTRATIWSCNPTPEHISEEKQDLKGYMLSNVHPRTVHKSQDMEATATSLNRGLDEENVVHLYNRYYSVFQKDGTMPFEAKWTDLEIAILSEVSQTEKEKYCMTSIIYRI